MYTFQYDMTGVTNPANGTLYANLDVAFESDAHALAFAEWSVSTEGIYPGATLTATRPGDTVTVYPA